MRVFKLLTGIALIGLLGWLMLNASRSNRAVNEVQQADVKRIEYNTLTVDKIHQMLDVFYLNPIEQTYLREAVITQAELASVKEKINDLNTVTVEKMKLLDQVEQIEWKIEAIDAISQLYQNTTQIISGNRIYPNAELDETITKDTIEVLKSDVLDKIPVALLPNEATGFLGDSLYNVLIKLLDDATVQINGFIGASEKLKTVEKIKIEDGQIGNIARQLRDFENISDRIKDKNLKHKLDQATNLYLKKFLSEFKMLLEEIPRYYDIAVPIMKTSKLLTKLLQDNEFLNATTVEAVIEEYQEVITEAIVTQSQTQYTEPVVVTEVPIVTVEEVVPEITNESIDITESTE